MADFLTSILYLSYSKSGGLTFPIFVLMDQKKLTRFEAIKSFPNILQYPEGMAGQWGAFFLKTPITKNIYSNRQD